MAVGAGERFARRMWWWLRMRFAATVLVATVAASVALWLTGVLDTTNQQTAWRVHTAVRAGDVVGPGALELTEVSVDGLDARLVDKTLTSDDLVATRDLVVGELLQTDAVRAGEGAVFDVLAADERSVHTSGNARTWWVLGVVLVCGGLLARRRFGGRRQWRRLLAAADDGGSGPAEQQRATGRQPAAERHPPAGPLLRPHR